VQLERRLAYPLNYSTGLAAMTAMGVPLFLYLMGSGRTILGRSIGAAMLPLSALVLWWTGSGLAIPLTAIGVVVYLVLTNDRLPAMASLALGAIGGLILIVVSHSKTALESGHANAEALSQGDQMLLIAIVVCLAMAGLRFALELGLRRLPRTQNVLPARLTRQLVLAGLALLVLVVAVAGASGALSSRWDSFKSATGLDPNQGTQEQQLTDISARGRYQFWHGAVDAWRSEPALGIGPGTFEFWWAQHGDPSAAIFVVNAHSLYLEVLAELGPIGFLLICAFVIVALIAGALGAWRSTLGDRPELAAATAACVVFAAAAAVDWVWQLAALPAAFMFLVAVAVTRGAPAVATAGPGEGETRASEESAGGAGWRRFLPAGLVAGLSVVALIVIVIPLASSSAVEQSREDVRNNDLNAALDSAHEAVSIEPWAATPRLQEATTLEVMGRLDDAVAVAREAVTKEPTNWRTWLILSRLEAENGNPRAAVEDYQKAHSLFPRGLQGP